MKKVIIFSKFMLTLIITFILTFLLSNTQLTYASTDMQPNPTIYIEQDNNKNGVGLHIGLDNIDNELSYFEIKLRYFSTEIEILDIINESNLKEFVVFRGGNNDYKEVFISGLKENEDSTNKLIFVPIKITSSSSKVKFEVNFLNLEDKNSNSIASPESEILYFQNGKISNLDSIIDISDTVSGLQYLAGVKNKKDINLINMASILPDNKLNVKDVIVLMQKLNGLRD